MKRKPLSRARVRKRDPAAKPKTPDDYLAAVSPDKRAALQTLRKNIKAAAPKADQCISYGVPAFRLNGKFLVAYAAAKNHCAFYPGSVISKLKELKNYDTSKGTIRFPPDKPLPPALVRKLVKLRVAKMGA
jgi:uncharacterized protein YdhG (YjbR/CyaY superfamily)